MNALSDHEAVTELLSLMKGNGRGLRAAELSYMISAIDKIDKGYSALYEVVMDEKKELEKLAAECIAAGVDPADIDISEYQAMQQEAEQFLATMDAVKGTIIDWATSSASLFKLVGVSALDSAMSASNMRNTLDTLRRLAYGSAFSILATQITANIEHSGGKFQTVFLAPVRAIKEMLSKANNAAYAAIGNAENPKQPAQDVREARAERSAAKKPSICQDLAEKKVQAAAHSMSDKAVGRQAGRPEPLGRGDSPELF